MTYVCLPEFVSTPTSTGAKTKVLFCMKAKINCWIYSSILSIDMKIQKFEKRTKSFRIFFFQNLLFNC